MQTMPDKEHSEEWITSVLGKSGEAIIDAAKVLHIELHRENTTASMAERRTLAFARATLRSDYVKTLTEAHKNLDEHLLDPKMKSENI